jgi:hypothetical protein
VPEQVFDVISGAAPLVLVAPHGGRRDPVQRPWRDGGLKVNDLHTAALTAELAAATGASALVNAGLDRNDTDLNRIVEAAARAPRFLELLATILEEKLATHERVTLLTVHGWNVVQASVDIGLGCKTEHDALTVGARAAISPAFAATALARLLAACDAHGIVATVGARYPARNAENLVQLFTARYRDDPRPPVRALAAVAPRVDAMQLELGIPLRWPGAWRERLSASLVASLPALLAPRPDAASAPAARRPTRVVQPRSASRLEFTSAGMCGLAALDGGAGGGRLLLFLPGERLLLFTGERVGRDTGEGVGPLELCTGPSGTSVRFRAPLLEFPDNTPFLDLETGLARGHLVDADVALDYAPHAALGGDGFGDVTGRIVLDGVPHDIAGLGSTGGSFAEGPWPRVRVALRLTPDTALRATLAVRDGTATGVLLRHNERLDVVGGTATLGPTDSPLTRFTLHLQLANGEPLDLIAHGIHRLPVVRIQETGSLRLEFAACHLDGNPTPAGWCEAAGV